LRINWCAKWAAVTILAGGTACGGSPPGPSPTLDFTLSASPNPITGTACAGCGSGSTDRESATTLTIRETGGVAGTVTAIGMVLRETGSNATIAQGEFNSAAIVQLAGSNRVAANGAIAVPCGVHYPAAQQGRSGTLTFTVRVIDERGNVTTRELAVAVSAT
jgi:hypothetical protein